MTEPGLFKEQEIMMPGVLSNQETWREKIEGKAGARFCLACVAYGKEFEFYPNYHEKAVEEGENRRSGRIRRKCKGERD